LRSGEARRRGYRVFNMLGDGDYQRIKWRRRDRQRITARKLIVIIDR